MPLGPLSYSSICRIWSFTLNSARRVHAIRSSSGVHSWVQPRRSRIRGRRRLKLMMMRRRFPRLAAETLRRFQCSRTCFRQHSSAAFRRTCTSGSSLCLCAARSSCCSMQTLQLVSGSTPCKPRRTRAFPSLLETACTLRGCQSRNLMQAISSGTFHRNWETAVQSCSGP